MKIAASVLQEIQKGVRAYKAFSEMEKALEYMANLEQVEKETVERIATVKAELASLQNDIDAGNANIELAKVNAKTMLTDAKARAEKIVCKANDEALSLIAEAQDKVSKEAENLVALQAECEQAIAQKDRAHIELVEIEAKLQTAKEQITKLLGV